MNNKNLYEISQKIRRTVFEMLVSCNGGHYASSFSIAEIITTLYFGGVLNLSPENPIDSHRDRFVLSKGHGAAALYAGLYHAGFMPKKEIKNFGQLEGTLGCTTSENLQYGIEGYGGSLGHGLAYAGGIALAGQIDRNHYHTFVLMGDGECQEGSVWEAALCISNQKIASITAIVDYNRIQAMGYVDSISSIDPLEDKWTSFGWYVQHVDGHHIESLTQVLKPNINENKPRLIIAHTIKGKGLPFLEDTPDCHYKMLTTDQIKIGREILGVDNE